MFETASVAGKNDSFTPAPGPDNRRRPRVRSRVIGWLLGQESMQQAREILVRDVSRLGVGFESTWMPRLEQTVKVRIGRGPARLAKEARVVNVRRLGNGTFCVGAEFC